MGVPFEVITNNKSYNFVCFDNFKGLVTNFSQAGAQYDTVGFGRPSEANSALTVREGHSTSFNDST